MFFRFLTVWFTLKQSKWTQFIGNNTHNGAYWWR